MVWVIIHNIIAFPPTQKLFLFCVVPWVPCYPTYVMILPWSITIFDVKNVVRIAPPLKNSWRNDTSHHHHSFLGPCIVSNQDTNRWTVLFGFCPSSNPIALKLMAGHSFLDYWLLNHHFRRWSCNPGHISGAPFNQCLIVYVFLEHTSLYHWSD